MKSNAKLFFGGRWLTFLRGVLLLILPGSLHAAGIANSFTVAFVRVDTSGLGYVQFTSNLVGSPPTCTNSGYTGALAFDTNTAGGKSILAVALAAQASGKKIYAMGNGTCAVYGVMEQWDWGYLLSN